MNIYFQKYNTRAFILFRIPLKYLDLVEEVLGTAKVFRLQNL